MPAPAIDHVMVNLTCNPVKKGKFTSCAAKKYITAEDIDNAV